MVTAARKITTPIEWPRHVVERNLQLTGVFTQHLLVHPEVLDMLPDRFELVMLPEDDLELRQYNLDLLDTYSQGDRLVVFVRLKANREVNGQSVRPQIYAPVLA